MREARFHGLSLLPPPATNFYELNELTAVPAARPVDMLRPAAPPAAPGLQCVAWRAVRKNTLQGFADLLLPRAGIILLECALPSKELRDAEGRRTGWKDRDTRRAWSDAPLLAAVQEWREL